MITKGREQKAVRHKDWLVNTKSGRRESRRKMNAEATESFWKPYKGDNFGRSN